MHILPHTLLALALVLLTCTACTRDQAPRTPNPDPASSSTPTPTEDRTSSFITTATELACASLRSDSPMTPEERAQILQKYGWTELELSRKHAELSQDPNTQRTLYTRLHECSQTP